MKHVSEKLAEYYGDDVTVCTTNSFFLPESSLFKKIKPAYEVLNGVHVYRLPFNRWHYPFIKNANKALIKLTGRRLPPYITRLPYILDSPAIKRMMNRFEADVIMATTISYDFCNYPLWRNKTHRPKPFVLYGAIHLHKKITDYNDPALIKARACDCYISNTLYEKNEMIAYGVSPGKIINIGTGIDIPALACEHKEVLAFKKKHNITEDDIIVGFVGRLVKGKGVGILLDALRLLQRHSSNIKLLLGGGTTDYVPIIKKAIKEENMPIILIEDFEESLKPVIYNAIDIFVLPSQSESFGVVFLEAWACKKPVIGTRLGAIASLVTEGEDGLLFTGGDATELKEKILVLVQNKTMRDTLGSAGYQKVLNNYTWPVIVKKYRESYELAIQNFKMEHAC